MTKKQHSDHFKQFSRVRRKEYYSLWPKGKGLSFQEFEKDTYKMQNYRTTSISLLQHFNLVHSIF